MDGLIPGHEMISRDREAADHNLFNDYFTENLHYSDAMFRQWYRMSRGLFLRIVEAVEGYDNYF